MQNFPINLGRFTIHFAAFADNYLSKGRHLCVYVTKESNGVSRQFALRDDQNLVRVLSTVLEITPTESKQLIRAAKEEAKSSKSHNTFIPAGQPAGA